MQPPPLPKIVNREPEYHFDKVWSHRLGRSHMEFLIKWKVYSREHNSLKPAVALLDNYEGLVSHYWTRQGLDGRT
jgi:hypothetical protein